MDAREIAEKLTEREAQVVVMANIGCRLDGCALAEMEECAPLAERGLMKAGPDVLRNRIGVSYYPSELGAQVSHVILANRITGDHRTKLLSRREWSAVPSQVSSLYDFRDASKPDDPAQENGWRWWRPGYWALNQTGEAVAAILEAAP